MTKDELIGTTIVGYRYGEAPGSGKSYNYRENEYEPGVSMAQVGYYKEIGSFAVSGSSSRNKYYYEGIICGFGGDDEVCLSNVKRITYREYCARRKKLVAESNSVVNAYADNTLRLLENGWHVAATREEIEEKRNKYLK
jgi:hypothetical protein